MSGMDKIVHINGMFYCIRLNCVFIVSSTEADGDLTCQSGARWEQINDTLKDNNIPLFFPVSAPPGVGLQTLMSGSLTQAQVLYV